MTETELKNKTILRPYQRRWVKDGCRLSLAVKAAQIGYSTASAAWAVITCLARPKQLVVLLSRSERQSLELAEKCKAWVDGYQGVMAEFYPQRIFHSGLGIRDSGVGANSQLPTPNSRPLSATSMLQHEIHFPNKSRIIALAANPDTARGYTGHVLLDEFAFHADAEAIFKAAYRQTTLGYKLKVLSTPNGQQGKFWELAKGLGLDLGIRPRKQPVRIQDPGFRIQEKPPGSLNPESRILNPWSGHWCDIYLAAEEGAPVDIEATRAGCDEATWLQEYCCQFVSQATEWISPELFQSSVSAEASSDFRFSIDDCRLEDPSIENRQSAIGNFYAGWDIARKRDLSVIWVSELVGDVTWTRGVIEMPRMSTVEQIQEARALLSGSRIQDSGFSEPGLSVSSQRPSPDAQVLNPESRILNPLRRLSVDMSGMGLAIVEQLQREFPDVVEGVQFTAPVKERLAVLARRRMEEGKCRIPDSPSVRHAFRAVRRAMNAAGQARFDAAHDADYGHADHFWAFALAEAAADAALHAAKQGPPAQPSAVFLGTPRAVDWGPRAMPEVF